MKKKPFGNKLALKLAFDAVLLLLLLMMYSSKMISMEFHEIGGLALIGLFAVHVVINRRWVASVTKKLFDKALPAKTRVGYLLNLLLVVSFALVGISGVFISHTVFNLNVQGMVWKTVHYSAAASALALIGVHIALHWRMISGFARKHMGMIKLPPRAGKAIGAVCLVALLAFGGYSLATTSFARWIAMPFTTSSMPQGGGRPDFAEMPDAALAENAVQAETDAGTQNTQRMARGEGHHGQASGGFSLSNVALIVARFGSISAVFAILAYGLERLLTGRRKIAPPLK